MPDNTPGQKTSDNEVAVSSQDPYRQLWGRWLLVAGVFGGLTGTGYLTLQWIWTSADAYRWLLTTVAILVVELYLLGKTLSVNRRKKGTELLSRLGTATRLTMLRGFLIAATAGFLTTGYPHGFMRWLPGAFYLLAAILDIFDGYVARRSDYMTVLGKTLDQKFDALGTLVAVVVAIRLEMLPVWYLLVGLAYYLFELARYIRLWSGKQVYELDTSMFRRIIAGYQMGFLAVALLPLFPVQSMHIAALVFFIPTMAIFTRDTGLMYGLINPNSTEDKRFAGSFQRISRKGLLPLLRLGTTVAIMYLLVSSAETFRQIPVYGSTVIILIAAVVLTGLTLLGIFGRLSSLLLAGAVGWGLPHLDPVLFPKFVLIALLVLTIFGTGSFSVWPKEEQLLYRGKDSPLGTA